MFWWIISWLLRWPFPVQELRATTDMSDVRLTWGLPLPTSRQRPLDYVRVDFRVDATFPWTEQDRVDPAAAQELLFVDVAPGEYFYQVVVVDTGGVESLPVETSTIVDFEAPTAVANLLATVE